MCWNRSQDCSPGCHQQQEDTHHSNEKLARPENIRTKIEWQKPSTKTSRSSRSTTLLIRQPSRHRIHQRQEGMSLSFVYVSAFHHDIVRAKSLQQTSSSKQKWFRNMAMISSSLLWWISSWHLLQSMFVPHWTEQSQHDQFRTWIEDVARCESESVMKDNRLKNHLCGSIREPLLLNSKILTLGEGVRSLMDNFFSNNYIQQPSQQSNHMVQQADVNASRRQRKANGRPKGKGKRKPTSSPSKGKNK